MSLQTCMDNFGYHLLSLTDKKNTYISKYLLFHRGKSLDRLNFQCHKLCLVTTK